MMARRGFALITMLWVVAGLSVIAATLVQSARLAVAASTNRIDAEETFWLRLGCLATVRARIDAMLVRSRDGQEREAMWRQLDRSSARLVDPRSSCEYAFEAVGTRLSLNTASPQQLQRIAALVGLADPTRVARTIIMSRDRLPIQHIRQLGLVGLSATEVAALSAFVSTDSGPVALNQAPREVLLTLPGMGPEVVERLLRRRDLGVAVESFAELMEGVSSSSAEAVRQNMPSLAALSTLAPSGWWVRLHTAAARSTRATSLDVLLVRAPIGVTVLRSRVQ